jgi:excisionase family DNA binding protein
VERFYSIKAAARRLQVSEKLLRKLYRAGRLRIVRIGRVVRVAEEELARLCERPE